MTLFTLIRTISNPIFEIPKHWIAYYQSELNLPASCFVVHRLGKNLTSFVDLFNKFDYIKFKILVNNRFLKFFYLEKSVRDGLDEKADKTPFDVNKLFQQVQEDFNNPEKVPSIIVANAGTEGGLDDKVRLITLSKPSVYGPFSDLRKHR